MPPEVKLKHILRTLRTRMRLCAVARRLAASLSIGLVISLLVLALAKTGLLFRLRLDYWPLWYALLPVALSAVVGVLWGLSDRMSDFRAACAADAALGLNERLGSAVVFANEPPQRADLVPMILADAVAHGERLDPRDVTGPLLPRRSLAVPLVGIAVAVLWFMPQYHLFAAEQEVRERQALQVQGRNLRDLAREVRQRSKEAELERLERLAGRIEALGHDLERGKLSKRQAMKETAALTDEVRARHRELAESQEVASLRESLAKAQAKDLETEAAGRILDDLAAGDLEGARQKLQELQQGLETGSMTQAERAQLAQDLDQIGKSLENSSADRLGEAMRQAAQSLSEGNDEEAGKGLERAAEELSANAAAQGLSEMQQLEALARELEFAEEEMARGPGEAQSGEGGDQSDPSTGSEGLQPGGQGDSAAPGSEGSNLGEGGHQTQGGTTDEGVAPFEGPYPGDEETGEGAALREYQAGASQAATETPGRNTRVRGRPRAIGDAPTMDVRGVGPRNNAATPYYRVERPTEAELESALDRQNIPASERPLVHGYFRGIE